MPAGGFQNLGVRSGKPQVAERKNVRPFVRGQYRLRKAEVGEEFHFRETL
jgi:hypothetical protein